MLSSNGVWSPSLVHTRPPVWVMLKILICILLWLAEYQCKGVVKLNLSDLFFLGQFRRSWKWLNWKILLVTLLLTKTRESWANALFECRLSLTESMNLVDYCKNQTNPYFYKNLHKHLLSQFHKLKFCACKQYFRTKNTHREIHQEFA